MCIMSLVMDYGQKIPNDHWTSDSLKEFRRMTEIAQQFDKAAGQPDCVDPEKEKMMQRIELLERKIGLMEELKRAEAEVTDIIGHIASVEEDLRLL